MFVQQFVVCPSVRQNAFESPEWLYMKLQGIIALFTAKTLTPNSQFAMKFDHIRHSYDKNHFYLVRSFFFQNSKHILSTSMIDWWCTDVKTVGFCSYWCDETSRSYFRLQSKRAVMVRTSKYWKQSEMKKRKRRRGRNHFGKEQLWQTMCLYMQSQHIWISHLHVSYHNLSISVPLHMFST